MAAVDAGISRRAPAGRFGVSMSSVIRWDARRRATGSFEPKPRGGDTRSRRIEARHGDVMAAFEEVRDQSLEEPRVRLAERGAAASSPALSRFFQRHGLTRKNGMVAPMVLDGPINGDWFEAYVAQILAPTLRPGDTVIMDNLSGHKRVSIREMIEAKGARLAFLPPYSPDFNPIEMAFAKLKALLRKAAERTVDGLWATIGRLVDVFTPQECANYFAAAGYDAD